jgi:hypothetical protein
VFRLLTAKWRILRSPLEVGLRKVSKVFQVCAMLHNFCIREDRVDVSDVSVEAIHSTGRAQNVENNELGYLEQPVPIQVNSQPGSSALQQQIRQIVVDNKYERPRENIERREHRAS